MNPLRRLAYFPLLTLWLLALVAAYHLDDGQDAGLAVLSTATALLSLLVAAHVGMLERRLARIGNAIDRFAAGDAAARAHLGTDDAVGDLGKRFDALADRLARERQALAESEERLDFALHGSNAGIRDWQLDSGRTYYSPRWKSLLGYAADELPAHSEEWLKRVHPDDLPRVMALMDAHLSGQSEFFESEHRLRRKDGSYLWVLERGAVLRHDGRPSRMLGALVDISARKAAEDALQRSEAAYRTVVESITQVIFQADAQGRLSFLNPAWSELTGFAREASLSRPLTDFVVADDRSAAQGLLQSVGAGGAETAAVELRLMTDDSSVRWFSLHARARRDAGAGAIAGVLTDIDVQKSALAALAQSYRERNAILDLSPDGFVLFDARGEVEYVNRAFRYMTGFAAAELAGAGLAELETRMAALCDPQKPSPAFAAAPALLYLQKPGKMILKWQSRSICNELEEPLGRVMYFRDVTRETEIDRMKTEFLSTAAHELRTPMASIFGFSELLLNREFDAATQRDLIETIHRQTRKLIDLVNELLDLARIEARGGKSFKIRELELAPVVHAATNALYLPAATHRLEVDLPAALPRVNIDADKFQQCLANVLGNAVKYSPQGGAIRVTAKERKGRNKNQVGIAIRDEGIGMSEEQVRRIFDRFYRADAAGGIPGTGLGMALVKETMGVFGGEVTVDSTPGTGTEVTLWLDAIPSDTAQAVPR